jgi:hypothetical protein
MFSFISTISHVLFFSAHFIFHLTFKVFFLPRLMTASVDRDSGASNYPTYVPQIGCKRPVIVAFWFPEAVTSAVRSRHMQRTTWPTMRSTCMWEISFSSSVLNGTYEFVVSDTQFIEFHYKIWVRQRLKSGNVADDLAAVKTSVPFWRCQHWTVIIDSTLQFYVMSQSVLTIAGHPRPVYNFWSIITLYNGVYYLQIFQKIYYHLILRLK